MRRGRWRACLDLYRFKHVKEAKIPLLLISSAVIFIIFQSTIGLNSRWSHPNVQEFWTGLMIQTRAELIQDCRVSSASLACWVEYFTLWSEQTVQFTSQFGISVGYFMHLGRDGIFFLCMLTPLLLKQVLSFPFAKELMWQLSFICLFVWF